MKHLRSKIALPVLFFLSGVLTPFTLSPANLSDIDALAPVEIVAQGFKEPTGIVVDPSGAIFVSDRKAGEVLKITGGEVRRLLTHLKRPVGLSFDASGRLLIVEEKSGFLLRLEQDSTLTVLAQGLKNPRWITVSEDGTVYISAKGLKSAKDKDEEDENEEQGEVILRLTSNGQISVFVDGFKGLQGLEIHGHVLFAAAKGLKSAKQKDDDHGGVFQIPISSDGSAGPITQLTQTEIKKPVGLTLDVLGALYVNAEEIEFKKEAKKAIGKIASGGAITWFASKLKSPRGMAFDSFGNLYVADGKGDEHGRLLRFRAPLPPTLIVPSFTNLSPLTVNGTAEPNSRIDAFLNSSSLPFTISGEAGSFFLALNLALNTQNSLAVFATSHLGQGLTSAPADFTIVHDSIPPTITNLRPLSGSYLNTRTPIIQASFSDSGSGVDVGKARIDIDGTDVTSQAQVFTSSFTLNPSNPLAEGLRKVSVTIFDRAGNSAFASTTFTVDVIPPDTQITGGPEGTISATSALFTFTGMDNLTPTGELQFSWRLDGGPFSSFSSQTQISLTGLSPGTYTFEVKARDLAGNEDLTPARRTFTISTLQVRITNPPDGAIVPSGSLLVRGTVQAGGAEVGVLVNGFPAAVQGSTFAALVPVTPDTTNLIAVVTTAAGATASHSVAITVLQTAAPTVTLVASPQSGVAPLTVGFSLLGGPVPASINLDFNGDGIVDFTGTSLDGQSFTYTQPELYVPKATMTDTLGNQFTASAIVQVLDRNTFDVMLQAKWSGMKDALRRGDIAGALSEIVSSARPRYEEAFQIIAAQLPDIDQILTNVSLIRMGNYAAICEATRIDDGLETSFEIRFALDTDGIWRVEAF